MKNRIRIESDENVVTNAKIVYVPEEGEEVDISRCVTGIDLHLRVGEISRATLHTILVDGHVTAELHEAFITHLKPNPRRWWRRAWDTTRFGSRTREYVSA